VPEDGERSAVLGGPVEQSHQLRLGAFRRQPEVAFFRERGIHHRERDLDEIEWLVPLEVPRTERPGDSGTEADRVGEAERRVVAKAEVLERSEIPEGI